MENRWINLTTAAPTISEFDTTSGLGSSINVDSNAVAYVLLNGVVTPLNAAAKAADRTTLAGLSTTLQVVYLYESGREGLFVYDSTVPAATHAADTAQGIYVAPNAAAGAWVRVDTGSLNVKWFGARGDGATNDTAAIQAALTAYPQKAWRVPPGNYPIGNLTVTQGGGPGSGSYGGGLYGDGPGVSNLICTAAGDALTLNNCWDFHVEGLTIKTSGVYRAIAGQRGIVTAGNSSNCVFRDLDMLGLDGGALQLIGTSGVQQSGHRVKGLWLQANGGNQFYSKYSNDFIYEDIQAGYYPGTAHAAVGVMLENSSEGLLTGTMLWNNNIGLKELNCQGNRYLGCRTEESDNEGWYSDGSTACLYVGNIVHTNSQTTSGLKDNWYFTNFNRIIVAHNQVRTWNALYSRYGINFDVGDDLILDGNLVRGFDTTNYGPYRVGGGVTTMDGDDVQRIVLNSLAAGATKYMGMGFSALETDVMMAVWRKLAMLRMTIQNTSAPGAGQSYTHTLRKNATTDTAMVATASGDSAFSARAFSTTPNVLFDEFDAMDVKSVASAGTAGTPAFRGILLAARY